MASKTALWIGAVVVACLAVAAALYFYWPKVSVNQVSTCSNMLELAAVLPAGSTTDPTKWVGKHVYVTGTGASSAPEGVVSAVYTAAAPPPTGSTSITTAPSAPSASAPGLAIVQIGGTSAGGPPAKCVLATTSNALARFS